MSSAVVNYYNLIDHKFIRQKQKYAKYNQFKISLPSRILICGKAGSGKTSVMLNIVIDMGAWTRIYLCAKDLEEPLYKFLIEKIQEIEDKTGVEILFICDNVNDLPGVDDFDSKQSNLVIIDDMINESPKVLKKVSEIFTRGRKKGITACFLSQSYSATPPMIRKNCEIFIFKGLLNLDISWIMREFTIGNQTPKDLMNMYNYCDTKKVDNFFMIDTSTKDDSLRFRHNWDPIYPSTEASEKDDVKS